MSKTRFSGLKTLFGLGCLGLIALNLLALAARIWSPLDILSLFHPLYALLALLLALALGSLKAWRWTLLALLCLTYNLYLMLPFWPARAKADGIQERDLRLVVHNILYINQTSAEVLEQITQSNPDIIFLMEYSHNLQSQLESHFSAYPYRLIEPSRMTMGLALFSRIPIQQATIERFASRIPIFKISFELNGKTFNFIGAHPWPPLEGMANMHKLQMIDIATVVKQAAEAGQPLIVVGDFNASPWSYFIGKIKQAGVLSDARQGQGLWPTWRFHPKIPLSLMIDHVFLSETWRVVNFQQGLQAGSDHHALILDLSLP
ncbi:MAG: endonuclease/exonuclease/phosphatase family protein [Deinococcales bacterium]